MHPSVDLGRWVHYSQTLTVIVFVLGIHCLQTLSYNMTLTFVMAGVTPPTMELFSVEVILVTRRNQIKRKYRINFRIFVEVLLLNKTLPWAASWQNQQNDCAPIEDSDQSGHPPSLIRVFAVRSMGSWGLELSSCGQRRLIKLGRCPVWSESSLGAHAILLVLSWGGTPYIVEKLYDWYFWSKTVISGRLCHTRQKLLCIT